MEFNGSYQLLWGVIFGLFGFAYYRYGRKQQAMVPLVTGIALCVFPYFISNIYALVSVGCVLVVLPYFVRA